MDGQDYLIVSVMILVYAYFVDSELKKRDKDIDKLWDEIQKLKK